MDIVLLAAVAQNGIIGRDNTLPWRLKSDMQHFRNVTMGKPVVMGRKTYQSIGKPLGGRTTIVVSRDPAFAAPGILVAPISRQLSRRRAATRCGAARARSSSRAAATYIDRPCRSRRSSRSPRSDKSVDGDARFPAIDPQSWRETSRSEHEPAADDEASFAFVAYERVNAAAMKPSKAS